MDSATLLTPPAAPAPTPPGPSQEDIRKVIADYKAREAKKGDKDKAKEVDDGREPPLTTSASGSASASPKPTPASPPAASVPPAPAQSHRKFALHRQIFDMRVQEIKRREQGVKAREVGKGESLGLWRTDMIGPSRGGADGAGLPQVPRGTF